MDKKGEKVPKRVIHFSDGAVPEYSTDEDDTNEVVATKTMQINPVSSVHRLHGQCNSDVVLGSRVWFSGSTWVSEFRTVDRTLEETRLRSWEYLRPRKLPSLNYNSGFRRHINSDFA